MSEESANTILLDFAVGESIFELVETTDFNISALSATAFLFLSDENPDI